MKFRPLSLVNLTQLLGFTAPRQTKRLLENPEQEIRALSGQYPHWARYLSHLLLGQPTDPEYVGDYAVLPVRGFEGISRSVALVPKTTRYGIYYFDLIIEPMREKFTPGTYVLLPAARDAHGNYLEPMIATIKVPRFPGRIRPFAKVIDQVENVRLAPSL